MDSEQRETLDIETLKFDKRVSRVWTSFESEPKSLHEEVLNLKSTLDSPVNTYKVDHTYAHWSIQDWYSLDSEVYSQGSELWTCFKSRIFEADVLEKKIEWIF